VNRKILIAGVLLALSCTMLWAGGRKENVKKTAEDPSGFTDSLDINSKPTGKWNYYLEARDKAGNIGKGGPENMFLDPESDLPRVTVVNPMPNMQVTGNLNIVGLGTDDDGVAAVDFRVNRGWGDKGEELVAARAKGTNFWSYLLDTSDPEIWTDGKYTITAWATDINGLSGISDAFPAKKHKIHQIFWHLDRKKPEIVITSHEIGQLTAGKIKVKGTVFDGNEVASLKFSIDDQQNYMPINLKYDKGKNIYNWEAEIDTKKFEDGPAIIWFKAKDGQRTEGTNAHLLFANNTNPEVKIVYPDPKDPVFGVFTVAGSASHPVGLKSITWKAGKESGEIELIKGNAWWSLPVDLRNQKVSSIDIEIKAEDVLGKTTTAKAKYKVDANAATAKVTLLEPGANPKAGEDKTLVVKGNAKTVQEAVGISAVVYSLNGGPEQEIPCTGYFQFLVKDLSPGVNTLDVWAKNVTGVPGPKVTVKNITAPPGPPEPRLTNITIPSQKQTKPFYSGMAVKLESKIQVELGVRASAPITSAYVTFGDNPAQPVKPGGGSGGLYTAKINVPTNLNAGLVKIQLQTTDKFNNQSEWNEYIYITTDEETTASLDLAEQVVTSDGRIFLRSPDELLIGMSSTPLVSGTLSGSGSESLTAVPDENGRIQIMAMREGSFGPLTLSARTEGGATVRSRQFRIVASFGGPAVVLRDVPDGKLVRERINMRYGITSSSGIKLSEYSLDMGVTWLNLAAGADVQREINLNAVQDGTITVLIRATGDNGMVTTQSFSVLKKTEPTEATLVMPVSEAKVNGKIRLGFAIQKATTLKSITYSRAGTTREVFNISKNWVDSAGNPRDYPPNFVEVITDPTTAPLDPAMRFIFEDLAGNTYTIGKWDFFVDNEADIPVVSVTQPFEGEVVSADFIISGVAYDDDEISKIYWSLDGGAQQVLDASNGFSIPVALGRLTDNEHYATIIAEDIYGVRTRPNRRNFKVSLAQPTAAVTSPPVQAILREAIDIRGTAADTNGIKEIKLSFDNGNTFDTAVGQESWTYHFNTKVLQDGAHAVFIKVWDKYDISATYSTMLNVDNTPPDVALDSPPDGSITTGPISIMGRVEDPNLENVSIEFRSLQGTAIAGDLRSRKLGNINAIKETLDISRQPDGLYNVEVVATDKAGNVTRVSRNVELARQSKKNFVDILYPLNNESVQGNFNLSGYAGGTNEPGTVTIRVNGVDRTSVEVDSTGYYRFPLGPEDLNAGNNTIIVSSTFGGGGLVQSRPTTVIYQADGPWITIDTISYGNFAYDRPYLSGRTGYVLNESDLATLADKKASKDAKDEIRLKSVDYTEISFDNGKTFHKTDKRSGKIDYRYRIETGDMKEGMHFILVRTTFKNNEKAVTRLVVQVDKTPPVIRLVSPEAGGRYNQELLYSASASDDVELISLEYHLRKGDKMFYGVPGFLQGLYFEGIIPPFMTQLLKDKYEDWGISGIGKLFTGATYFDVGMGLSFFEDNVKIQFGYGLLTQDLYESIGGDPPYPDGTPSVRYGGHVFQIKIIANIYRLPFGPIWGPDFEWLSATFAFGADFSLFDLMREGYTQSKQPTWMSALLFQVEFPRVTIPKREKLRTFALFTEASCWFVPTDKDDPNIPVVIPHVIMGIRIYIF
jgi:hypothetical protein